jgi:cbb3-type cytochrome c oxidase subunit III
MIISKRVGLLVVVAATLLMGAICQQAEEKPDGAEIFRAKCSMCHGVDGKGFSALKTPDFTSSKWQDSVKDSEILNAIKNGKKDTAMPAFSDKLSEKEILAVLQQVRAFGKKK